LDVTDEALDSRNRVSLEEREPIHYQRPPSGAARQLTAKGLRYPSRTESALAKTEGHL